MKKLLAGITLALSLGSFAAFAEEPAKAPASPGAPTAVTAPAATTPAPAATAPAAATAAKVATPAATPEKKTIKANPMVTIPIFLIIIAVTMAVVVWSAKRTKSAADFYTAGGGITGTQNGWAIAGDYMSAASFLGISGMISLYGYDGFMYSVGWLVAYITVLLIVAEPCRNAGKYTLGDILSFRTEPKVVRAVCALSVVAVSTFYLTAQMVGAGKLMQLLIGIPYKFAIIGVGILMVGYVVFGGMTATTWVQIIKAGLLMTGAFVLSILVGIKSGMNPFQFFNDIATSPNIIEHVQKVVLKDPVAVAGFDYGQRFLEPGLFMKNPLDQISLGMALVLGTAGMPHILMRFFTVPTAQAARKSVIVAMFIIGFFYILTTLLGFGAAIHVTPQGISAVDKGGNMAAMMLAQKLGGDISPFLGDLLLAFLCAVAFATILAVVSGLVLAASAAIAHDIYVNVIKDGHADQHEQVMAARITSLCVGAAGILIGIAAEKQNVAHLVALAFAVASSGNLPVVVMSLFWRKFNTAGVVSGLVVGTIASIALVMVSPNMTYPKKVAADAKKVVVKLEEKQATGALLSDKEMKDLDKAKKDYETNKDGKSFIGLDKPLIDLKNPGIISIPLGFIAAIIGCLAFPSRRSEEMFDEIYVRQNTGIGMAKAIDH
ncbi:SSS sodium solute transporter superfamily [Geobacter metallireducens RCH3]|uniref:Sodium/solute symporter family protein n=1 Tax=Geobacter metallireducens (strain ATCC 53774 / DSM 7210 / GS-15) TaxID=269799 RepID=Q39XP3_GEOMG|nr:cation acetate symporter [Geobacter metallireducens]ABB30981.2 sodium/solute symporter family protein [Geobacter metallireducens GS-15]EHP84457.1 SSS sodium solute transporter superfamily [Geobacter metallireducens RCH3]